jgi:hypothetical protein
MPKFVLKMGDPVEFEAPDATGFLDAWRSVNRSADADDGAWMRTAASLACDWSGKAIRFESKEIFASDMMRHGMLEEVEGVQG